MTKQELYLKTMFCCMACDGDIAKEEIELVKAKAKEYSDFKGLNVENFLNKYVEGINRSGSLFLKRYLNEISNSELTKEDELKIVNLSIEMIEADNNIEYSEVKFFKKIRSRLSVSDEKILELHPDKEDFLLPDINVSEDPEWDSNIIFKNITINNIEAS